MQSLDDALLNVPLPERNQEPQLAPDGPPAIVLVESYAGLGVRLAADPRVSGSQTL